MKKIILIILVFTTSVSFSQDYGNNADALKICSAMQSNNFTADIKAENALEKILNVIGASKRFVLQPCNNINNAVATTYKGIRYILYDADFMNTINNGNNWGNLFILAHEVGHHINGHSLDLVLYASKTIEPKTLEQRRKQELEADEFAGFILAKLEGDILEANKVINKTSSNQDDIYSTHPNATKRLNAIQIGYNKALGSKPVVYENKTTLNTAEEYFYSALNNGIEKYNKGDYQGAIADFSKVIDINPNYSDTYNKRGSAKGNLDDIQGAMADFSIAIQLDPNNSDAYKSRGVAKAKLGDYRGAIADYSKAIELESNNSDFYDGRAVSKDNLQDYLGAINDFTLAIELSPKDSNLYYKRGLSKAHLEDYQGVIMDNSKAIELEPNNSMAYFSRGIAKMLLNQKESACLDWSKSGELGYSNAYKMIQKYCN
jgi:tetratricopeptide (TPR) repeat protein